MISLGGNTRMKLKKKTVLKSASTLLAAGALTFALSAPVRADEGDCQRRVAGADHQLHEAIEHHGYESREARHARQNLQSQRQHCWDRYHRWWDEDGHRWHQDRDWDDHDHDHAPN